MKKLTKKQLLKIAETKPELAKVLADLQYGGENPFKDIQTIKGEKGDKGDKGDDGIQGPPGIQGPQGIRGEKGDKGDKGETGPEGPRGKRGEQGPPGIQGEKGDHGEIDEKKINSIIDEKVSSIKTATTFLDLEDTPSFYPQTKMQLVIGPTGIGYESIKAGKHIGGGGTTIASVNGTEIGVFRTIDIVGDDITGSIDGKTVTIDFSAFGGSGDSIIDADEDTKVEVEQSPDEDVIRGTVAGTEKFYVDDRYLVSTDTFRDAFGPIRNQESNQYLTSVYNNSGFGGAALGDIKMSTSNISIFDLSTIPSIPHSDGFHGALTDGRYIYLIPRRDSSSNQHGIIVRYDTTKSHTSTSSYDYFDLETLNANCKSFIGGAYHSGYIYLANNDYGENVRYNVELPFDDSASWEVFDTEDIDAGVKGYQGIVTTPTHLYYIPYSNGSAHGQLTRFDVTGDFTNSSNWEYFDMTTVDADAKGFAGGVFDGRYVYLAGFNNPSRETTIRYDTLADFSTGGSYTSFETTDINANARGYIGMSFDGRYVYYSPFLGSVAHGLALRFDSQGTFTNTSDWELFDITTVDADAKGYIGMSQDARYVYYTPRGASGGSGLVTRYDKSKTFQSTEAWEVFDLEDIQVGAGGYVGGVAIGDSVYLSPNESTYFPRIIGIGGDPNIPRGAAQILRGTDVHLAPNGFLGIGHGDPDSLTHIKGPGSATVQASSGSALLHLESTTNSYYAEILFTALDSGGVSRTGAIGMDGLTGNDNILYLANGAIQGLVVDRFGHVGILNQTPNSALDVEGNITISDASFVDYEFSLSNDGLNIQSLTNGNSALNLYSLDGDSSDFVSFVVYGLGTPGSTTNRERAVFQYNPTSDSFRIRTENGGTGSILPLVLQTGSNDNQIYLDPDGTINFGSDTGADEFNFIKNQAEEVSLTVDNGTNGASAFTSIKAINDVDNRVRLGITASSADFANDAFDGGVGFVDTNGTALNLVSIGSTGDFNFFAGGTSNSDIALHIDGSTGYIGMGTNSPDSKIHALDGTVAEFRFNSGASDVTPTIAVGNTDAGGKFGSLIAGTNGAAFIFDSAGYFAISGQPKTDYTNNNLGAGGTEYLRIDGSTGYIGMGTSDPQAAWEVSGTSNVRPIIRATTEDTSYNNQLIFATGSGVPNNNNVTGIIKSAITQANPSALKSYLSFFVNTGDLNTEVMRLSENAYVGINETDPGTLLHYTSGALRGEDGTIEICQLDSSQADRITNSATSLPNFIAYSSAFDDNSKVGLWVAQSWTSGTVSNATHRNFGLNAFAYLEGSTDASITASGFNAVGGRYGVRVNDTAQAHTIAGVAAYNWHQGSGTVTNSYHYYSEGESVNVSTGLTITNLHHFRVDSIPSVTGTVTNQYGVYVPTLSNATNNYGAYIEDNVGIGDATPSARLAVANTTTANAIHILQTGDTGNGASTSGAFFLNNTSNPGIGANYYDNGTTLDVSLIFAKLDNTSMDGKVLRIDHEGLGGSLIELNANNASHNDPILRINGSGTGGGQADIRIDSPNPDIEFIDTDYTTPDGKYEIDVGPYTGGKSALRMNSRNDADNSFESIAYFFRKGSTGGGMAIEDGVITVGGYDVTASDGYGRILVNSNAVSPSSIDLGNSITVGTGTGGANATAKHLGNFAWMSRDSSFSAPKIVAHISVEATETYAADTDVGSRMVFYTGTDNNTNPDAKMAIEQDGQILLNNYGSGTFAGAVTTLNLAVDSSGNIIESNTLNLLELSADPSDPAEGRAVIWQSDGTGSGDDGDIMIKITAGSTTKTVTLIDFSVA